jgi:cob(I)alamin adenosyltransferase
MAKHTRIYTRTGDDGTTGLYSGERVRKSDPRIEAYGTVDELSSAIGVAIAEISAVPRLRGDAVPATLGMTREIPRAQGEHARAQGEHARAQGEQSDFLQTTGVWLEWVQDKLFDLGAELATPSDVKRAVPAIRDDDVGALERAIDEAEATLPTLDAFIHPGGSAAGAALHVARTVCRRAERRVLALRESGASVNDAVLRYLNRLSDALFVWARATNAALGSPERRWKKESSPP